MLNSKNQPIKQFIKNEEWEWKLYLCDSIHLLSINLSTFSKLILSKFVTRKMKVLFIEEWLTR